MMNKWLSIMEAEEKRTGLPAGMLASLVKQETGGQQRFIDNPADFHYKAGPNGEKPKSTARGLGGILESTARDPGYGVSPLKDWSVPEQLRFMADYTKARIKQAGSIKGGLAGYGEGGKYSQQVLARMGKSNGNPVNQSPLQLPDEVFAKQAPLNAVAQAQDIPVQQAAPILEQPLQLAALPKKQITTPVPVEVAVNQWEQFQNTMPAAFKPNDMNYMNAGASPGFSIAKPNFDKFKGWMGNV